MYSSLISTWQGHVDGQFNSLLILIFNNSIKLPSHFHIVMNYTFTDVALAFRLIFSDDEQVLL